MKSFLMAYKHSSLTVFIFFFSRNELLCLLWIARNIILIIILSFFALIAAISSIIMLKPQHLEAPSQTYRQHPSQGHVK